jgi:hypothetical protein
LRLILAILAAKKCFFARAVFVSCFPRSIITFTAGFVFILDNLFGFLLYHKKQKLDTSTMTNPGHGTGKTPAAKVGFFVSLAFALISAILALVAADMRGWLFAYPTFMTPLSLTSNPPVLEIKRATAPACDGTPADHFKLWYGASLKNIAPCTSDNTAYSTNAADCPLKHFTCEAYQITGDYRRLLEQEIITDSGGTVKKGSGWDKWLRAVGMQSDAVLAAGTLCYIAAVFLLFQMAFVLFTAFARAVSAKGILFTGMFLSAAAMVCSAISPIVVASSITDKTFTDVLRQQPSGAQVQFNFDGEFGLGPCVGLASGAAACALLSIAGVILWTRHMTKADDLDRPAGGAYMRYGQQQ